MQVLGCQFGVSTCEKSLLENVEGVGCRMRGAVCRVLGVGIRESKAYPLQVLAFYTGFDQNGCYNGLVFSLVLYKAVTRLHAGSRTRDINM